LYVSVLCNSYPACADALSPAALEHLVLNGLMLTTSPKAVKFPRLVTLTIDNMWSTWLSKSFPSLRAICGTGTDGARNLPAGFPPGQLDMVQIDHFQNDHSFPHDFKQRYAGVPILLRLIGGFSSVASGHGPKPSDYEHLSFSFDMEGVRSVEELKNMLRLVQSHSLLKSLCLPISLSLSRSIPSDLSSTRDDLLTECSKKGIDVVWRINSLKPEDDVGLSRDFWRYAKGLKKKKQLEAAAAAAGSSGGSK
jgi:hypothetical protein